MVFENYLYVSSWRNLSIIKLNKFQPNQHEIVTSNISRPFSVIVYHRQRQPEGECIIYSLARKKLKFSIKIIFLASHPCKDNNGGCQQICVPLYENKAEGVAHCMCEPGYKLVDKRNCICEYSKKNHFKYNFSR